MARHLPRAYHLVAWKGKSRGKYQLVLLGRDCCLSREESKSVSQSHKHPGLSIRTAAVE